MTKKEAEEIGAANANFALDSFGEESDYPRWEDAYWAFSENLEDTIDSAGGKKKHIVWGFEEYNDQWERAGFNPNRAADIF